MSSQTILSASGSFPCKEPAAPFLAPGRNFLGTIILVVIIFPVPYKVDMAGKRRVLFLNPAKQDRFAVSRVHMGLSLLGEILVSHGHEVKIIDYAFLRDLKQRIRVPDVEEVIDEFKPDLIGISVFSYLLDECRHLIDRISKCCDAPLALGGIHYTVFPPDLNDKRVSYVVRGEAEEVILNLVETAKREPQPVVVEGPLPSHEKIPASNLDIVYGSRHLRDYQIQLSRGCPYKCSFCNVCIVAGRRIRARDLDECVDQIVEAKKRYPQIEIVTITDDCPTFDKERFKRFLRMFREAGTGCEIRIDNVRANLVDEEMIELYQAAGGLNICLGVESGNPEVFEKVNKGETLEEIIAAAKLVRKFDLELGLCFVIGLPGDNLERHADSMRLARQLAPDYIFWNMCIPWPGTEVHEWYKQHGTIGDLCNFSTLIDPRASFKPPVAASSDFSKRDRIKAWLMANMETPCYFRAPRGTLKILFLTLKYGIYRSFSVYFAYTFLPRIRRSKKLFWRILWRALARFHKSSQWPP